jgi:hypothetical protein
MTETAVAERRRKQYSYAACGSKHLKEVLVLLGHDWDKAAEGLGISTSHLRECIRSGTKTSTTLDLAAECLLRRNGQGKQAWLASSIAPKHAAAVVAIIGSFGGEVLWSGDAAENATMAALLTLPADKQEIFTSIISAFHGRVLRSMVQ